MKKLVNKVGGFFKKYRYEILVFIFFVLVRLPSLGHDSFNTDVWRWKARSYDFGNGVSNGDFKRTLQMYHPGVTLMWLGSAGVQINNTYAGFKGQSLVADDDVGIIFQLDFIQKLLVVCAQGFAVAFIFYALRNIFGYKYSLISLFILTLEPFYLGLTRMFHLEGLVSNFMLVSVVWLYYYFLDIKNRKRLIVSALFAGFAILTKTSAVFLIPFCALTTFIYVFRNGKYKNLKEVSEKGFLKKIKRFGYIFFLWFAVAFLTFVAFWPALWVIPGRVFQTLYEGIASIGVGGDHTHYYFGNLVDNPGSSFYFVVLAFKSSIYLLLGFFGSLFIRKKLPEHYRNFLDFLLVFIFFYFLQLTIPSKKLDRYILPMLVVMSLASSIFFVWVFEKFKFNKLKIGLFLILVVFTALFLHPDYLSYYNPLFGGIKTGVKVLEPKWLIGTNEIIEYFEKIHKEKNMDFSSSVSFEELVYKKHGRDLENVLTVGFREKYYTQIWPFFKEFGAWAVISELTPFAERTKYFVYPVWDDGGETEDRFKIKYIDTISLRGAPLYNVYTNESIGK